MERLAATFEQTDTVRGGWPRADRTRRTTGSPRAGPRPSEPSASGNWRPARR